MLAWREVADPSLGLEGFEGQDCHRRLGLASRTDLATLAVVFPDRDPDTGKARYAAFARCYLNEAAVLEARNPSYPGWAAEGHLAVTPGNETDFDRIEGDVLELCRRFRVASVGFDPWQSTQMAQRLRAEGVNMLEFRATTQNFSPAILELDAACAPAGSGTTAVRCWSGAWATWSASRTGAATSTLQNKGRSRRSTPPWR